MWSDEPDHSKQARFRPHLIRKNPWWANVWWALRGVWSHRDYMQLCKCGYRGLAHWSLFLGCWFYRRAK